MLYLWKGTENRHITTAKWSIEHKDGELNIKGKITFAQIFLILFIIVEIIFAAGFTFLGIAAILDNEVIGLLTRSIQPFGFNGYEMDEVGGLYFAQARRYDAGVGRFVSEDFIKGHIAVPYTMNHYNYCWNRPMD